MNVACIFVASLHVFGSCLFHIQMDRNRQHETSGYESTTYDVEFGRDPKTGAPGGYWQLKVTQIVIIRLCEKTKESTRLAIKNTDTGRYWQLPTNYRIIPHLHTEFSKCNWHT